MLAIRFKSFVEFPSVNAGDGQSGRVAKLSSAEKVGGSGFAFFWVRDGLRERRRHFGRNCGVKGDRGVTQQQVCD